MTTTVTLGDRTVDAAKAFPLTIGDWKALKREHGITPQTLEAIDRNPDLIEVVADFIFYALHKADPSVRMEEIDALPLSQLMRIAMMMGELAKRDVADVPFSRTSTPSRPPTGGRSGMSSS